MVSFNSWNGDKCHGSRYLLTEKLRAARVRFEVGEGIEKKEQLTFLHGHHCTYGQGYLFSRPLPPDQIPALRSHPVVPQESQNG